jgi:hypothetical protein
MKTIKVSEASNDQLDGLVYECEKRAGRTDVYMRWFGDGREDVPWCNGPFHPSTDWSLGGPIIEREGILLRPIRHPGHGLDGLWLAMYDDANTGTLVQWVKRVSWPRHYFEGPTPLIAAMRCYVASKLGESVEVPEELT